MKKFVLQMALAALLPVVVPVARADSWTATGPMMAARTGHAMALLHDGRVLVVGGYNAAGVLASAEVYDPSTGTFANTGSMSTSRWLPSATPVGCYMWQPYDLRLLIAGGVDAAGQHLSSAELYDPTTRAFRLTGSMSTARRAHSATPLSWGVEVLIAGGFNGDFTSTAEVYDLCTGQFAATGSMTEARRAHTATRLRNGKVLIVGGENSTGYLSSAELYEPGFGTFSPAGSMGVARTLHSATLLPDGKVLIAGGFDGSSYLSSAELYDPAAATFTPVTFHAQWPRSGVLVPPPVARQDDRQRGKTTGRA